MEKEPSQRYQSAAELTKDVRRFVSHQPVAARPAGNWYRFRQFTRRNKALVASMALSTIALISGTAVAVGQAIEATRERDAAQRRLAYAQQTANYVFAGVGSQIGGVLGTGNVRRHLTEAAYMFYNRLAEESPHDQTAQSKRWAALRRLALQSLEVGNLQRARLLAERARELTEDAIGRWPESSVVRRELMYVSATLAMVANAEGDIDAAVRHVRRASEMCEQFISWYDINFDLTDPELYSIPQVGPESGTMNDFIQVRRDWAFLVTAHLGPILLDADLDEAEQLYGDTAQLIDELWESDPTIDPIYRTDMSDHAPLTPPVLLRNGSRPYYQRARSEIHAGLGTIAMHRGHLHQAEDHFLASLKLAQALHQAAATQPSRINLLATAHGHLAELMLQSGAISQASAHARKALNGHQRLADSDPKHVGWQRAVANDNATLGRATDPE